MEASPVSETPTTHTEGGEKQAGRTFPVTTVPTRRSRRLVLTGAISVALISTGSAYLAMVQFGIDVLAMNQGTAYATAGVFELSLVTVALLAREAARDNRPGGTLLALTWALSSASGVFAAWHEAYIGHPIGAVLFRFVVPLLAALMWHLALIGDRHLATGTSWTAMRTHVRMHALWTLTEDYYLTAARLQADPDNKSLQKRFDRVSEARRDAKKRAQRTVPPAEMRTHVAEWTTAGVALGDGDQQVADSVSTELVRTTGVLIALDDTHVRERAIAQHVAQDLGAHTSTDAPQAAQRLETGDETVAATGDPQAPASAERDQKTSAAGDDTQHEAESPTRDREVPTDTGAQKVAKTAAAVQIFAKNRDITGREMAARLTEGGFTTRERTGRTWVKIAQQQLERAERERAADSEQHEKESTADVEQAQVPLLAAV